MSQLKLNGEQLIAIPDVPLLLPVRHGKTLHISTVYRWVLKGARGKTLESAMLGGIRYTSLEALGRFLGASTAEMIELQYQKKVRTNLSLRGLVEQHSPKPRQFD